MRTNEHRCPQLGATRVEIMLGVIIVMLVGVLAAVVVPREERTAEQVVAELEPQEAAKLFIGAAMKSAFESANTDSPASRWSESQEAAVTSNLATIRQAIAMYEVQHEDTLPIDLVRQLTLETDVNGNAEGENAHYGPYLRNSFPANPVSGDRNVLAVDEMPIAPMGSEGWIYCPATGEIRANVVDEAASGSRYFDL